MRSAWREVAHSTIFCAASPRSIRDSTRRYFKSGPKNLVISSGVTAGSSSSVRLYVAGSTTCSRISSASNRPARASTYDAAPRQRSEKSTGKRIRFNWNMRLLAGFELRELLRRGLFAARLLDNADIAAGQLADPIALATPDGFLMNEVAPDPHGVGAGRDEVGNRGLIDPPGGDERDRRERTAERADVAGSAHCRTGENFHEIRARFPGSCDLRRGTGAGKHHDILFQGKIDDLEIQSGGREKPGAGVQTTACHLYVQNRAGACDQVRAAGGQTVDDFHGSGNRHRDFDDGNPAAAHRLRGEHGILGGG